MAVLTTTRSDSGGERGRSLGLQMEAAALQELGAMAIGQQAEVANAYETGGQNVQQEATEKLIGLEGLGGAIRATISRGKVDATGPSSRNDRRYSVRQYKNAAVQ